MLQVDDGLYRGGRLDDTSPLLKANVKLVISLQRGWWEIFHDSVYAEDAALFDQGINMEHIACSDFRHPTGAQTLHFLRAAHKAQSGGVYVHCLHGVDRTGWMCAAWRIVKQDWSADKAVDEWKQLGFHRSFYFWWESAFRKNIAEVKRAFFTSE